VSRKIKTFVDASVLITAARGAGEQALKAISLLDDPDRQFVDSDFLELEVLPKAVYTRRSAEADFYRAYFAAVAERADVAGLVKQAIDEACKSGLSAVDALHIVAAATLGAEELVSAEKPNKPIYRTNLVRVRRL
jgi:hypothetical protein